MYILEVTHKNINKINKIYNSTLLELLYLVKNANIHVIDCDKLEVEFYQGFVNLNGYNVEEPACFW